MAGTRPPTGGWLDVFVNVRTPKVAVLGGGPGGYEAALVAAQLGADVTVIVRDGLGGAAVLTDCVPSKTLIATAEVMTTFDSSYEELAREARGIAVKLRPPDGDECDILAVTTPAFVVRTPEEFAAELREIDAWNRAHGYCPAKVDPGFDPAMKAAFEVLGLAEMLH